ncbi:hypothetical protein BBJ28_00005832 [Nothophytophthora sp. Chile5]|nr:hypothetical protein BBJ28_00005832 [Nothophytophthora sp. Chile5]
MWTAPPHPPRWSTLVPRLNLEELLLTRPDDEDLEQMTEEDGQHDPHDPPSTSQPAKNGLLHACGFNISLGDARANNNEALDTETLRFLEKLDLKAVLHTPRPDLLSFYPSMPATPVKMSVCSPSSKAVGNNALEDDHLVRSKAAPFNSTNEKSSAVPKALSKETRADGVASRLAYMETTYGTMPCAPRKTRRGTIDRLANPISGHSSTLQALSPEQRKKREMAALSGRAPLKLTAAAVSGGSGRRSVSVNPRSRREKSSSLFEELGRSADVYEMVARLPIPSKRKLSKRRDPLIQRRRAAPSASNQTEGQSSTQRKSKATGISCSLTARKEALKKKLQSRVGGISHHSERFSQQIGGATFLTQHDDEEGTEGPGIDDEQQVVRRSFSYRPVSHASVTPPSPTKMMILKTAARAGSFFDSLRESSSSNGAGTEGVVRQPEHAIRQGESSRTSSYPGFQPQKDVGWYQRGDNSTFVAESGTPTTSVSSRAESASSLQCNVGHVRVTSSQVAVYSLVSHVSLSAAKVTIERRFREFYAFALHVCTMFPTVELLQRLPPKTYCNMRRQSVLSDGFLLRRKSGIDDFLHCALDKMMLAVDGQGTIAQWYLLRLFLNLSPALATATPTKDRSLVAAMHELKKHARQSTGWTMSRNPGSSDTVFEKTVDSFPMVKRVTVCHFPARAVFDMVMNCPGGVSSNGSGASWAPFVERDEVLNRENEHIWTERTVWASGSWRGGKMQMISRKCWKVDESGTIAIVMIPADVADWEDPRVLDPNQSSRVDCILGGWLITPMPQDETCSVTWLMQANFGQCDPRAEFTGSQSRFTAFFARRCLLSWADQIVHLLKALGATYNPTYYRELGPLVVGGKPRVYV